MLTENVIEVEKNIQAACDRAGRSREEVRLIIEEVLTTGILDYGENKVQELSDKYDVLPKNIRWHMIGHLQRNKVKYLIGKTVLIHSVDSLRLAEQIEHEAAKADTIMNVLIEVNVAGEESKFGTTCNEAIELVRAVAALKHVKIKGLMTIAPFTDNPEDNRIYFKKLKQLSVDIKSKNIDNVDMDELSMGMTGDYEVAIEEGERNYQI